MSDIKGTGDGKSRPDDDRKRRLAEQLRANLQRRKARTRARKAGEEAGTGRGDKQSGDS